MSLPTPLCPAPAAPWETSMLCHASCPGMGHIPLSLGGTTAGNKGLSSALAPQCPGSGPWRVGAGIRVCGWHREGGIHPHVQHHPRAGSLHPMPAQEITQDVGDDADTTYPCPGQRGLNAPQPWGEGQVAAVLGGHSVKGSTSAWGGTHCPPWGSWCACPAGHRSHLPGKVSALCACPPWLWDLFTCTRDMVQRVALSPGNIQLGPALVQVRTSWPCGKTAPVPTDLKQA